MGQLSNKVAVITGGNSGIGLASAQKFIEEGAKVVIFGRDQHTLEHAVETLGSNAVGVQGDVTNIDDLQRLADTAKNKFGKVDILFANAGLGVFAPIEMIDQAAYDKQFDINVKGAFFTVQQLLPLLSKNASVILTASAVHEKGVPNGSLYFATKAAVRSFARTLAAELAPKGIRVNTLSPGIVRTHFSSKTNLADEEFENFIQMVASQAPLAREGSTEDMANGMNDAHQSRCSFISSNDGSKPSFS